MRRSTLAAIFGAALLSVAARPAFAGHGAFAFEEASGKYGFSTNEDTEKRAEEMALKACGSDACKIVFRTKPRECGAIATTENGKIWGGATRPRREAAELAAIEGCQKRTPAQCKLRAAECNR